MRHLGLFDELHAAVGEAAALAEEWREERRVGEVLKKAATEELAVARYLRAEEASLATECAQACSLQRRLWEAMAAPNELRTALRESEARHEEVAAAEEAAQVAMTWHLQELHGWHEAAAARVGERQEALGALFVEVGKSEREAQSLREELEARRRALRRSELRLEQRNRRSASTLGSIPRF